MGAASSRGLGVDGMMGHGIWMTRASWAAGHRGAHRCTEAARAVPRAALAIALAAALAVPADPVRAAGTVGTGSAASCTESALDAALIGGGTVTFNCGAGAATITLTAQKAIFQDTALDGGGTITLSGGGTTGLFQVGAAVILRLSNLALTDGMMNQGGAIDNAGVLSVTKCSLSNNQASMGGAVFNGPTAMVTIASSVVSNNRAPAALAGAIENEGTMVISSTTLAGNFGGLDGGAIINSGTLTIEGCTFEMNQSAGPGGAIVNTMGGAGAPSLTISASTFSNNSAGMSSSGGSIYQDVGSLSVTGNTFVGNSAGLSGGGVFVIGGTAGISQSTFSGNSAGSGGAIFNGATLSLAASTLSANTATSGMGAGIWNDTTGTLTVTNSTVSGNAGEGIRALGNATMQSCTITGNTAHGLVNPGLHSLSLQNTIVSGNGSGNCLGTMTSLGSNLESGDTCGLGAMGDLRSTEPFLGALADNGGPTKTQALPAGSPAIDAGSGCPSTDQRGLPRPADGNGDGTAACDIGAYEYQPPGCATAATFDSIDCRLTKLMGLLGGQVTAGALQDALAGALGRASGLVGQAETAVAQGKNRGARRKLAQAIGALQKFERTLRSRRAKGLPSAVRDSLKASSADARQVVAAVRRSLPKHG